VNISGGPEELATFIRSLNDEPIYLVQEKQPVRHVHRRPAPRSDGWVTPAVCCAGAAIFGAIASFAYIFGV
jgi:hypothetical protein